MTSIPQSDDFRRAVWAPFEAHKLLSFNKMDTTFGIGTLSPNCHPNLSIFPCFIDKGGHVADVA